jgi:enoyl-CoA hydratase/carnithine racemase
VATLEACEARAIGLAQELAAKPRHALGYTKRWLNEVDGSLRVSELDAALEASLALVGQQEQREMLAQVWAKA